MGTTVVFASMKFNPKFLVSLAFFLDDLYYYRYHHYNYTESVRFFMNKIELVNMLRLNFNLLDFIDAFGQPMLGVEKNQHYLPYFPAGPVMPDSVYFLSALEGIYKEYVVFLLATFGGLRVISLLCGQIGHRVDYFRKVHRNLNMRTSCFVLVSSLLLDKIADVSFSCSLQLSVLSRFSFLDSVNLAVCTLAFFSVLFYVLTFYVNCVHRRRKETEQLVIRSKPKSRGIMSEMVCSILRVLLRSVVHGALLDNYATQILALLLLDMCCVVVLLVLRKGIVNRTIFVLLVCYGVLFLIMDGMFLVDERWRITAEGNSKYSDEAKKLFDRLIFYVVAGLVLLSLLITVVFFVMFLRQIAVGVYKIVKKKCAEHESNQIAHFN